MGADAVHPTDQTLQAYGLGKFDDVSAGPVSKHLESCPSCQRRVAELSSDDFLGRLRNAQGAPEMSATSGRSQLGGSSTDGGPAVAIAPPPADTLPPGLADHLDYEVIGELGRGGMGVVYLVRNKLMGRLEVLKVVSGHLVERPGVRDRFLREVQSAAKLQHKNIVTAYSAMRLGESIVLAMEYVQGDDLAKEVKSGGPLPVINACYFIYQAALGLQHAHERGMVHRDIRPANLIVAREGKKAIVKVLDFGLAKVTSEGQADSGLTREGQMLGTPEYIAPEQIRDAQSADIRADIYSLGCTFYYLLTGGPPFRGDSLWDLYQAHFSMDAGPLNLVRPDVPVELAAVVAKMMAKDPRRRFQTPGEVAQALTPFFKQGSVAVQGANPEISQVGQPAATQSAPRPVPVPARPAMQRTPAPVSEARTPAPTQPGSILEGLVDLRETEPLFDKMLDGIAPAAVPKPIQQAHQVWSTAVAKLSRLGPRRWWAAAGVLLLGFVVAWAAGVLRVKTSHGMIELVNLPKDAEVFVDGEEVAVTWPGGGKPAVVTVTAGKHKIKVKKDGIEISGHELTVQAEGKEKFTVRFVPPPKLLNELPKDDDADSTRTAKKDARPDASPAIKTASSPGSFENSIGMTLKRIPAGEFFMGAPDDDIEAGKDEKPSHRVRISKPFYLGICEVTQAQYEAVMGNNPSHFSANGEGKDKIAGQSTDRYPVENVSWLDAVRFCNVLSEEDGKKPFYEIDEEAVRVPDWHGQGYRLPTEAEWEYACRANAPTPTRYSFGDNPVELGEYGWFNGNSEQRTHPVAQKRPNGFGLYDMHGNAWEWCWDWYGEGYYSQSPANDPTGPAGVSHRVIRGGSWSSDPRYARSALRHRFAAVNQSSYLGFRLALNPSDEIKDLSGSIKPGIPSSKESKTSQPLGGAKSVAPLTKGPTPTRSGVRSKPTLKPRGEWTSPTTKMGFVRIKAGEFMMGSPDDDKDAAPDEKPQHKVRISPFYLGVTEVTQAQYEAVMGSNPSHFSSTGAGKDKVAGRSTGQYPVESVSWLDAVRFCNTLSSKEGFVPFYEVNGDNVQIPARKGPGYRLPTEAEWEYACRADAFAPTRYSFGNDASVLGDYGWVLENSGGSSHPVGERRPNGFGLYDMHGNVWEWCWDSYGEGYYKQSAADDPTGPVRASDRVARGGCWGGGPRLVRSARRLRHAPGFRNDCSGFRLALGQSGR